MQNDTKGNRPVQVDAADVERYDWGVACQAWRLLDDPSLSVNLEEVPPGSGERAHLHRNALQFFYMLSGSALIEFEGGCLRMEAGQGARVPPGCAHRFRNDGADTVRFLVISSPPTTADRVDL
jgi:mannose-6-phosphate isomerase-like protein (cupin superfamily)